MLDGYVSDYLLALPPLDATPATVRIYIGQVLQNHHDVSKEEAEAVAAKWLYGRGSELLVYYDIDTFRSIFGAEAGMLLFGYARKELGRTSGAISSTRVGARVGGKVMDKNKKDIFGLTPGCKLLHSSSSSSITYSSSVCLFFPFPFLSSSLVSFQASRSTMAHPRA